MLFSCLAIFSACEKEVEFNAPDGEAARDVTINAVAIEGEPLRVFLNRAYSVGQAPLLNIGYEYGLSNNDALVDYLTDDYYKKTAIHDAEVKVVVNGQQNYTLALDGTSLSYTCDYRPKEGDRIEVRAEGLSVETIVPPKPRIEILDYEILAENPYKVMNGMKYDTDTIMRIKCRIPESSTGQYYRLRVRGEKKITIRDDSIAYYAYYKTQDIFFSDDVLFADNRLTEGFGGWPTFFSNVFNNTLIVQNGHTFIIDSPKPNINAAVQPSRTYDWEAMRQQVNEPDIPARVMVELQALSPELYRYLKSVELFRITENDAFSEPVQIYSNVEGGWGILGALSYDRHFVEYGD